MVELLYNNINKTRHRKEKLTYHPMIQTDLSTLSPEHVHTLASLSYHCHCNRAKKIISDPFTRLTPFSTVLWNMLQITAHSYNCFQCVCMVCTRNYICIYISNAIHCVCENPSSLICCTKSKWHL